MTKLGAFRIRTQALVEGLFTHDVCNESLIRSGGRAMDVIPGHRLTWELRVPAPLDQVFEFFADARNLEQITPPWVKFEVLTPDPIEMRAGTRIDYRLRIRGLPVRWQSQISVWDPPHCFVDEQRRGPYHSWHHKHTFEAIEGGTAIHDDVHYVGRGWLLEPLVNRLLVRPDVLRIFAYRRDRLVDMFGELAGAPPVTVPQDPR